MGHRIQLTGRGIFVSLLAIMILCFASPAFATAPEAVDDTATTNEDTAISIYVMSNDDLGTEPTSISQVSDPPHGTATINDNYTPADPSDDYVDYEPDEDYYSNGGPDVFIYWITNEDGSDYAAVEVTVDSVNDAPVAVDDTGLVAEGGTLNESAPGVLENDSDVDGDPLTVNTTPISGVSHGTLTLYADGSYDYVHDGGESTSDFFEYEISDGHDGTDTAMVDITITPVNDAPVAADDTGLVAEGGTLNESAPGVLANDSDVDGDPLTVNTTPISGVSHGTLTLYANGAYDYVHDGGESAGDFFVYEVLDGKGGTDTATVDITITPVNDAPVAADDTGLVAEGGTLNESAPGVLANDSDVDGDPLTVNTTPISGVSHGTLTLYANGAYDYVHDGSESAGDFFVYEVLDGKGGTDTATVDITITRVNDAPVAVDDSLYSTDEDTSMTILAPGLLSNDTDVDGDELTLKAESIIGPSHGVLYPNLQGGFIYEPDDDFNGIDTFTYHAHDGTEYSIEPAMVTITVAPVNDAPVAGNDTGTVAEGGTLNESAPGLLANDSDVDEDPLTVNTTPISSVSYGILTLYANGAYDYVHDGGESASDSFIYEVSDGNGGTDIATVDITITRENDAPVAADDTGLVAEGGTLNESAPGVLANDSDVDGDPLTVNTAPVSDVSHGILTLYANGAYDYVHDGGESASDFFIYEVSDGNGGTDIATVDITITRENDAPVAADDTGLVAEGGTLNVSAPGLLANDSDVDGDTLTVNTMPVSDVSHGILTLYANGAYDYVHDGGESASDFFIYEVSDGNGGTDIATVDITITRENDAPVAADDTGLVAEGGTLNVSAPGVLANDSDVDGDPLTVNTTPISGVSHGILTLYADGSYQYIHDDTETTSDSFIYEVLDGNGGTDTATVSITIDAVNEPPVAVDDPDYETEEDTWLNVNIAPGVLGNDSDPDVGDTLTMEVQTFPSHGDLFENPEGTFIYDSEDDFNGIDTFTYRAYDGIAYSDAATVTITVTPVNDEPDAVDDNYNVEEESINDLYVLANDINVDADNGDVLTIIDISIPPNQGGSVTNNNTYLTYEPALNFAGDETFTYTVEDTLGKSDDATVTVTVDNDNDPPVAADDGFNVDQDSSGNILDVLANDTDVDNDTLTITDHTDPANGTVVNNGTDVTYTPDAGYIGQDIFSYDISDGNGGTDTATVTVTVDPLIPPPVFTSTPSSCTDVGTPYYYRITAMDPQEDAITITGTIANWLTLTDNGEGTAYLYGTPGPADLGDYPIELIVSDGESFSTQPFTINVAESGLLPRDGWIVSVDSYQDAATTFPGENALDGDPNTFWHTEWWPTKPTHPHWIEIDLGDVCNLVGFRYLPRQDIENGRIKDYEFFVSVNGSDWASAVTGTFPNVTSEQEVLFESTSAQYIRLVAYNEFRVGKPATSIAELNLIGAACDDITENDPPVGVIEPIAFDTIYAGESIDDFVGTGSDPEGDEPLTYLWSFGDPTVDNFVGPVPGPVQFNTPGVHTVTLTVTDAMGRSDPTPATQTITVNSNANIISQDLWTVHYVDSEELSGEGPDNGRAEDAFDNNEATYWHTQWLGAKPLHPHFIEIDLNGVYDIEAFYYVPRQDIENGRIKDFRFYVSADGVTWGEPVVGGVFLNNDQEQGRMFPIVRGRFIRMEALSEFSGRPVTSMAELRILAAPAEGNLPANGEIINPSDGTINVSIGAIVDFQGEGMDPENNVPLSYLWEFRDSSDDPSHPDSTDPNVSVQFTELGTYTAMFTVTDSLGASDPTPATRTIIVGDATIVLPRSEWSLLYVDSQEVDVEDGRAVNAFDGNSNSMWHTQWFLNKPSHPHEIQIDLGKFYNIDGYRHLPRQDGVKNGRIKDYKLYVSIDGSWDPEPVASGILADVQTMQEVLFEERVVGRYIRLVADSDWAGKPVTSLAELNLLGNFIYSSLDITPDEATVVANGTVNFTASDGEGPYIFSLADDQSGGYIDQDTGVYTAGSTTGVIDTIQVRDATYYTVEASVTVTGPVEITPSAVTIAVGGMQDFDTFSGVPPFIFDFVHNNSGGNINENTGVYQAGSTGGVTDTVRVTDAESTTSEATISVIATPLLIEPKLITVEIGGTVDFDASGGEPAYSFSIADNQSDAIIDQDTGIYIAV